MQTTQGKRQKMLNAIERTAENELSCNDLTDDLMALYAERTLAGHELDVELLQVHQHLAHCPDCAREVADIVEILGLAQKEEVLSLPYHVQPDLSFLPTVVQGDSIPQQILEIFEQGRLWVQDQTAQIWVDLAAGLFPTTEPQLAFATRSSEAETPLYHFSLGPEEVDDLDLEVTALPTDDPALCTFIIQVRKPSQWQNMAGFRIVLLYGPEEKVYHTDEKGQLILHDFMIADLKQITLRIAPS